MAGRRHPRPGLQPVQHLTPAASTQGMWRLPSVLVHSRPTFRLLDHSLLSLTPPSPLPYTNKSNNSKAVVVVVDVIAPVCQALP